MVSTAYLSSPFSFLPPHNPFPLELLRSCRSPTLNASAASYSSSTTIQTSCEALHSHSASAPLRLCPTLLTHGLPLCPCKKASPVPTQNTAFVTLHDHIHGALHTVALGRYLIFVKTVKEQPPLQRTVGERGLGECQEVKVVGGFDYGMCSRGYKGRLE